MKGMVAVMNSVWFVIKGSNNFHKLELSKTLLHFIEFDFTYFWEQCIEAGKNARKFGSLPESQLSMAKNSIFKCHPYIEAKLPAEFEMIALDCIIEFICHSEKIGLEELWNRCISPKNSYERQIFRRISEYKTNRAINQWVNIVRIQEYAKKKLDFIFGGEDSSRLKPEDYRVRKDYFDLCLSVASNEFGMTAEELPYTRVCNPACIPDAPFMLSKVAKGIYKRFSGILSEAETGFYTHATDPMRDQMALDAFSGIKNMTRPAEFEMKAAVEALEDIPDEIYIPNSFKAVIDLEFDLMIANGIYMQKCEKCERFFTKTPDYNKPFCNRVSPNGKTCRELMGYDPAAARAAAMSAPKAAAPVPSAAPVYAEAVVPEETAQESFAAINDSVKRTDVVPDNIPAPEERYPAVSASKWEIFDKPIPTVAHPEPGSTEFAMDDILSQAESFLNEENEKEQAPSFDKAADELTSRLAAESKPIPEPEPEPVPEPKPEPVKIIRQSEIAGTENEPKPFKPPVLNAEGEVIVPAELPEKKPEPEIKPFTPPVLNREDIEPEMLYSVEKPVEQKPQMPEPKPFVPPVMGREEAAPVPVTISPELEKRCQKMYNALYKKVGKSIGEEDFREWSQYLSNMKRNVKNGEAPESDLLGFIEYSEKTYGSVKQVGRPKKNA